MLDFEVSDVDAEYQRVAALGVEWVMPPTTQPWGNRSMIFKDPDGNLVNVFSRPPRCAIGAVSSAWKGRHNGYPGDAMPDRRHRDQRQGTGTAQARHLGLALVVISLAQLMLVLDELIVNTALPHIQRALHFSGTGLEWVVTGYAVTFGGLLLLGGRAGDVLGRRRDAELGNSSCSLLASLARRLGHEHRGCC